MKALVLIGWVCLAAHVRGGTVVTPNGFESVEGNSSAIALFGGDDKRTQVIYGSQHFSLFPPEGAYITELRFRMDGANSSTHFGRADLEIHLSTSSQNPNVLNENMDLNVGPDEIIALSRSTIQLTETPTNPGGPHAFSVVIPLLNKFYYQPANGHLLMDAFVYSAGDLANLDWQTGINDGVSAAVHTIGPGSGGVSSLGLVTQFVFVPVPEPATVASLIFGFFVVGGVWRRKVAAI
jgi:hypothetical protein